MSFQNLRDIALANVAISDPSYDYFYRRICRWYATTFHTPLSLVEKLETPHVLTHFFEHMFETMDEEELALEVNRTLNPGFDQDEEADVQNFIQMIEDEERTGKRPKLKKKKKNLAKSLNKQQSLNSPVAISRRFEEELPPEKAGEGLDTLAGPSLDPKRD